jgi:hypothetical protein
LLRITRDVVFVHRLSACTPPSGEDDSAKGAGRPRGVRLRGPWPWRSLGACAPARGPPLPGRSRASDEMERTGVFFGEQTAVRRVYLRVLAHTHERMEQVIGDIRMMGMNAPWPGPMDAIPADGARCQAAR